MFGVEGYGLGIRVGGYRRVLVVKPLFLGCTAKEQKCPRDQRGERKGTAR